MTKVVRDWSVGLKEYTSFASQKVNHSLLLLFFIYVWGVDTIRESSIILQFSLLKQKFEAE